MKRSLCVLAVLLVLVCGTSSAVISTAEAARRPGPAGLEKLGKVFDNLANKIFASPGMRRLLMLVDRIASAVRGGAVGGGGRFDRVLTEVVRHIEEFERLLDGARDEASMRRALPKVKALATKMKGLKERFERLGRPPKDQMLQLQRKYEPKFRRLTPKIRDHKNRLRRSNSQAAKDLVKELRRADL